MNKRTFTAQRASNQTIKIFEGESGSLYRVIHTGGNIVSSPYVAGNTITVTVETGGKQYIKNFSLPHGGLKSTTPVN